MNTPDGQTNIEPWTGPAMSEPTPLDLALIKARAEIATPGPWKTWGMSVLADPVGDSNLDTAILVARTSYRNANGHPRTNDADFIAAARTDVPALLAEIERLRGEVLNAREVDGLNVCRNLGCMVVFHAADKCPACNDESTKETSHE